MNDERTSRKESISRAIGVTTALKAKDLLHIVDSILEKDKSKSLLQKFEEECDPGSKLFKGLVCKYIEARQRGPVPTKKIGEKLRWAIGILPLDYVSGKSTTPYQITRKFLEDYYTRLG